MPTTPFRFRFNEATERVANEESVLQIWREQNVYVRLQERNLASGAQPFVLHDAPPYANGEIHLGHVLNITLKDLYVKMLSMMGVPIDFIPGWDCHGLPIENAFLKERNATRHALDPVELRDGCHAYAEQWISQQMAAFQRLGIFGKWESPFKTMDPTFEAEMIRTFAKMASKGYIVRSPGKVNWCESCETVLAGAEIEDQACWRCKLPVKERETVQWFARLDHHDIRTRALEAVEKIVWVPEGSKNMMLHMVSKKPDWCLSRQRVWGVPIPAIHCESCSTAILDQSVMEKAATFIEREGAGCWYSRPIRDFLPKDFSCTGCGGNRFRRETDIFDVWFDSGVTYKAVNLQEPADLVIEGADQFRGWYQSLLWVALMNGDPAPFKKAITHQFVGGDSGTMGFQKMSKSSGNYNPVPQLIESYGVDVLRLWAINANLTAPIHFSVDRLNDLKKLHESWRKSIGYLLGFLHDFHPDQDASDPSSLTPANRALLARLDVIIASALEMYQKHRFPAVVEKILHFLSHDIPPYLQFIWKDSLWNDSAKNPRRKAHQTAIWLITKKILTLIAPILPFTAEDAWSCTPVWSQKSPSVLLEPFPKENTATSNDPIVDVYDTLSQMRGNLIDAINRSRGRLAVPPGPGTCLKVTLFDPEETLTKHLEPLLTDLAPLVGAAQVEFSKENSPEDSFSIRVKKRRANQPPKTTEWKFVVGPSDFKFCARCFSEMPRVGEDLKYQDVCSRCADALHELKFQPNTI